MAKKKKTEQVIQVIIDDLHEDITVGEPQVNMRVDEPEVRVAVDEPKGTIATEPKEPMITVKWMGGFINSKLVEQLAALGYTSPWTKGETRTIPVTLYDKCTASGARFQTV